MIYTGYFACVKEYKQAGLTCVSIALKTPDWYHGATYKALVPTPDLLHDWHDKKLSETEYRERYEAAVLATLTPEKIVADLSKFAENVVLLCYEKSDQFCHRHLVVGWLNAHGIPAQEYTKQPTLF